MGLTVQRARLAARIKHHYDPDSIDEARRDLKAAKLAEHIRAAVDQAPPLTAEQVDRLTALFRTPDDRDAA